MRFNLKVPFSQKDAAKELGARWDATRKIWYVLDPEALEVFSDWMPQAHSASDTPAAPPESRSMRAGVFTGPAVFNPLCHCNVLPWDPCQHTEQP